MSTYRKRRRLYIVCIIVLALGYLFYHELINMVRVPIGFLGRYLYEGPLGEYSREMWSYEEYTRNTLSQFNLLSPVGGLFDGIFHLFLLPMLLPLTLSLMMFRLTDTWVSRTNRKDILKYNNKRLIEQSIFVAVIFTFLTGIILFGFYGKAMQNRGRVILYLLIEFLFFSLLALSIGQIYQLIYYCLLSHGVAILLTEFFYAATAFLQIPFGNKGYWLPSGLATNLFDIFFKATYEKNYLITPGMIRTVVYWSVSTLIILAVLELFKRRIMLHRNFLAKAMH